MSTASLEAILVNFYWPLTNPQIFDRWPPRTGDSVILTTFFDYLASSYGRDKLPLFLAALANHSNWETLCRTFFGQSTEEFAAGWQEYLVTHYGIARESR
jgi:hypothetical protein